MVEQVHESGQWVKLNPKYEKYGSKEENQEAWMLLYSSLHVPECAIGLKALAKL